MKNIKFRVWNKGINSMYPVYGFNQRQIQWCKEDGSLGGSFSYGQNNKNKFILMQFTGLTDKNGKEIYEGDLLFYAATNHSSMVVKFEHGSFVGEGPFNTLPLSQYLSATDFEFIEVIGNIYENPELL